MLRMITPIFGSRLTICAVASMPLSSGMAISIITMSGFTASANRTASRPSAASPTTSMPCWRSSRNRTPLRTTPWSSASRIRTVIVSRLLVDRNSREHCGALSALRRQLQFPAELHHALLHSDQPEAPPAHRCGLEAHSVVLHRDRELPLMNRHADVNRLGSRVPRAVRERFLHDAVDADPVAFG